jgi:hypothetical protein
MQSLNNHFYDEDQWGQFIDIERQQLFPKQIINYVTTIKTETKTTIKTETKTTTKVTTTQPLKSILKNPNKMEIIPNKMEIIDEKHNPPDRHKIENDLNNQFQKFIVKQLYIGYLICILTFGFCLIP